LMAVFEPPMRGSWVQLLTIIFLGCAAIAAPGTFYGLITSQARGSSVMLPLLLFPFVVPALLASATATTRVFQGDPMNQVPSWMGLLVVINVVHWSISAVFYGWIYED
jgi:heme exporter protein B